MRIAAAADNPSNALAVIDSAPFDCDFGESEAESDPVAFGARFSDPEMTAGNGAPPVK